MDNTVQGCPCSGGADIESGSVLQQESAAGGVSTGGGQVEGGPVLTIPHLRVSSPVQEQLQTAVMTIRRGCVCGTVSTVTGAAHTGSTVQQQLYTVFMTIFGRVYEWGGSISEGEVDVSVGVCN